MSKIQPGTLGAIIRQKNFSIDVKITQSVVNRWGTKFSFWPIRPTSGTRYTRPEIPRDKNAVAIRKKILFFALLLSASDSYSFNQYF